MGRVVVVVEDVSDLSDLLRYQMEHAGFEIRTWTTDFEALLQPEPWEGVDVALIDHMLPRISGAEIATYVHLEFPGIRIIVLSALAPHHLPEELVAVADALLQKPATPEQILEAIGPHAVSP